MRIKAARGESTLPLMPYHGPLPKKIRHAKFRSPEPGMANLLFVEHLL